MARSHVLQFSLALVLSLAAGVLVFRWMNQPRTGPTGDFQTTEKVMVAVAAQELDKGTKLESAHVRMTPYLPESLPSGHFSEAKALTGRVIADGLAAGEPITGARLVQDGAVYGGVSTLVTPGKRAIAVKGNKVLGLSGYIHPGNRVDVLVTLDDERRCKNKSATKLVLENIRVLATGSELEQNGENTSSVDVYTLEMSPEESERLALADNRGALHFALRNPADEEKVLTPGTNVPDVLGQLLAGRPKKSGSKASPAARVYTKVEVITGANRKTLRF
jgi:pilus assembly protein CpaB